MSDREIPIQITQDDFNAILRALALYIVMLGNEVVPVSVPHPRTGKPAKAIAFPRCGATYVLPDFDDFEYTAEQAAEVIIQGIQADNVVRAQLRAHAAVCDASNAIQDETATADFLNSLLYAHTDDDADPSDEITRPEPPVRED